MKSTSRMFKALLGGGILLLVFALVGQAAAQSVTPPCGLTGLTTNNGATITYFFAGTLADPFGSLAVGTPFTGSFSYAAVQPNLNTGNYRGDYLYQSISLTFGSTTVTDNGTGVINLYDHGTYDYNNLDPFGNPTTYPTDLFHLYTFNVNGSLGGLTLAPGAGIQLVLEDATGTAWTSTALPGAGLTLANVANSFILLQDKFTGPPSFPSHARGPLLSCVNYTLTVTTIGPGSVSGSGIDCGGDCDEDYPAGMEVYVTADPEPGATFDKWSGGCFDPYYIICTVIMDEDRSVTAEFYVEVFYLLEVIKEGTGSGTVTSNPVGINCGEDCKEPYAPGMIVNLSADPDPDSTFDGWRGRDADDGDCEDGQVTMDTDKECIATFTLSQYTVTPLAGANGSISPNTPQTVNYDQTAVFTVNPDPGYHIDSVSGCGGSLAGHTNTTAPIKADCTVSASFANAAPTVPTLAWPADGSEVPARTPELTVNASTDPDGDPVSYISQLDTVSSFDSEDLQTSGVVITTTWTPEALADNTTGYWRARATDGTASSAWMSTAGFFVNTENDAPGTPSLLNPADGSYLTVLAPTLSVSAAIDPDNDSLTYDFRVYSNSSLTGLVTSATEQGASWLVSPDLDDNTRYWWTGPGR